MAPSRLYVVASGLVFACVSSVALSPFSLIFDFAPACRREPCEPRSDTPNADWQEPSSTDMAYTAVDVSDVGRYGVFDELHWPHRFTETVP